MASGWDEEIQEMIQSKLKNSWVHNIMLSFPSDSTDQMHQRALLNNRTSKLRSFIKSWSKIQKFIKMLDKINEKVNGIQDELWNSK